MAHIHHISITANSGVGSTTTSKKLHSILGYTPWRWVNAGGIMRMFAEERGMSIEEFSKYMLEHPEEGLDKICDDMISKFAEHDYALFEGRIVHHFTPQAFHVRLVCDPHIRAERRAESMGLTVPEMYKRILERDKINDDRYVQVYGREVLWDDDKFDLVLDTGKYNPDEISEMIITKYKEWLKE